MTCAAPCPELEILDERIFHRQGGDWDELLSRSYDNRIFYSAAWYRNWFEHPDHAEARIFVSEEDGRLQAVLPLQLTSVDAHRTLSLAGDHNVSDYMDALADSDRADELLSRLWHCAIEELDWDRLELRHVPSTSPLVPALQRAARLSGLSVGIEPDEVCPVAILCSSWDGYLEMLSKKQRHEIRRKLRRATEGVDWEWRTARTHQELDQDLPVFFRLHEASAGEKRGFMTPAMRTFFTGLSTTLLDRGILRLSVFQRDGVDLAASMGFLYRDRYLLYNSGYDPAYAAASPGIAAVALAMQQAIEEKAVAFDFLSGDEPYKYQFGAVNTYTSRVTIDRT